MTMQMPWAGGMEMAIRHTISSHMIVIPWHFTIYGISKPSLDCFHQILRFHGHFRHDSHSVCARGIPVYPVPFSTLLDNTTFNWGIYGRYYPSVVNSFDLGCVLTIDKDGSILTRTSGWTLQLSSNEEKRNKLKGPLWIGEGRQLNWRKLISYQPSAVLLLLSRRFLFYVYICIFIYQLYIYAFTIWCCLLYLLVWDIT